MNRIKEIVNWLVWVIKSQRRLKKSVKQGHGKIEKGIKVRIRGEIKIGEKVTIQSHGIDTICRSQIFVHEGAVLEIGNHSGMTATAINCKSGIKIGDYVKIGAGCLLMDFDFHSSNWQHRMNPSLDSKNAGVAPIIIDDHVFIGARSIICKGVHIGEKSIIATGSVVVKDIPANCVAGGNPCKVIKQLEE